MKCLVQGPMCGKWSINVWDDGEENDDEEAMLHVQHKFSFLDSWVPKAILL